MQLRRVQLNACRSPARLGSSSRRSIVRATGSKPSSTNAFTKSLLDFFQDITEGARDGPRRRTVLDQDVPDVTDLASKVHQAADAVEAAAAGLQGMLGDASHAAQEAFAGLDKRALSLKQQLLKGEKDLEAVVDEVLHLVGNDTRKLASTLTGADKQAGDAAHALLDAAMAKAQQLRNDAQQGLVTAEHAADEVVSLARAMLQELQHLLSPRAARKASTGAAAPAAAAVAAAVEPGLSGNAAVKRAAATDAAAAALEATAAAAAVISEKGLEMADKTGATDVKALGAALDAQVILLRAKAGQLQLQAASGGISAAEAVEALLTQFSAALGAVERGVAAGSPPGGSASSALRAALQRCRTDAATGTRMVTEAAARQDISSERAVQYLTSLLRQLAADLAADLSQQERQQQKHQGVLTTAAGMQDNVVVASVDELELVLQGAFSQSQAVRAAAQGFASAEAVVASLQQRLPELKRQAAAAAAAVGGGSGETARKAAARVLSGVAGEVEGQLSEVQAATLAGAGGGAAGAAAAAALQVLSSSVEARAQQLANKVQSGQLKSGAAFDELLLCLQSSISGELRSCLLDSLTRSTLNAPGTASVSISEDEIAAQLATAIAVVRQERAAAVRAGLDEAIAAGQLAAWVVKAAVGVGALQLAKAGAGLALERVGVALPGALGGMLGVAGLLLLIGEARAEPLVQFYDAYLSWTEGLLPLLYVPTLAVVPMLLQGTDILGLLAATVAGTAASLLFAASVAAALTPKAPSSDVPAPIPSAEATSRQAALLAASAFAAVAPLVLTKFDSTGFGHLMTIPVGLAWTLFGFLAGRNFGVNPMLLGAAAANAGVFWHGKLMDWGYGAAIDAFFGQGAGAGELLTALLGMALTGMGFVIYKQRRSISLPAVAVTAAASAAFSVLSTVGATYLVPLSNEWAKAFVARGITTSLAPDVAASVGAAPELAAIAVLLQATVTVVLGGTLLKLFPGSSKAAAAGIAAGCTGGVLGAAAVSQGQGAALANGVLAYTAVHALSALVVSVPVVGEALQVTVALVAA